VEKMVDMKLDLEYNLLQGQVSPELSCESPFNLQICKEGAMKTVGVLGIAALLFVVSAPLASAAQRAVISELITATW
jgi:hypothetical protein